MTRENTPTLNYIRSLYAPEDTLLSRIKARLAAENIAWQVGAEEGRLLQLLITLAGARNIVEVGTLAGYSTLWMARALPAGGHIHTLEKNEAHAAMAREFFTSSEVADRITLYVGDARETLARLSPLGPFDMVFIDADKGAYNDYLDWAEANLRAGGLLVADNTLLFGAVLEDGIPKSFQDLGITAQGAARNAGGHGGHLPPPAKKTSESAGRISTMRRFNDRLADAARWNAVMIPTQEGLSVAVRVGGS